MKGIAGMFLDVGAKVIGRATGAVLSDRRGQEALARAVGMAQRGLQVFESVQERALHAAGLAAKPDYHELRKAVARVKRKARELSERIDAAGGAPPAPGSAQRSEGDAYRPPDDGRAAGFDVDAEGNRSGEG
jgi:hypothetical protein